MIEIFGIRHHGPGSARAVRTGLERLRPDTILIEGPPEAGPLVRFAPECEPPVALLAHVPGDPARSAFWPFAVFSPEWQAILYGTRHGLPIHFCDLPAAHTLAVTPDAPGRRDPIGELATAAGYDDPERWWEDVVEHRDGTPFAVIAEAMGALREGHEPDEHEARREAHMRKVLRAAVKAGHQRIAVVCGAWHTPALAGPLPPAKSDNALLRGLPKVKAELAWVPWTYERLATRSGYGAGVGSPGWYHHLFTTPDRPVERWLTAAAGVLREEDLPVSSAHVIESVRLAETLAALRGRPLPGLGEVTEAARAVLCEGDELLVHVIQRRMVIGDRLGHVADGTPMVPLQRDLRTQQRTLRLHPTTPETTPIGSPSAEAPSGGRAEVGPGGGQVEVGPSGGTADVGPSGGSVEVGPGGGSVEVDPGGGQVEVGPGGGGAGGVGSVSLVRTLDLDLRKPLELARSHLLHRLGLLGVPWGVPGEARGKGTFRETWRLEWRPEFDLTLIEAAALGTTVEAAATRHAHDLATAAGTASAPTLAELAALVERCLLAGLTDALPGVLDALGARAALDTDLTHLMAALPAIVRAHRYGDVRGTPADGLAAVARSMLDRIRVGLAVAMAGLAGEAAGAMLAHVDAVHAAVDLLDDPQARARWLATLMAISDRAGLHGLVEGRLTRILLDAGELGDAAQRLSRATSRGSGPARAAAWLEGFLGGGGLLLVHDARLLRLVDAWLAGLPGEQFTEVLPLLRRTFGGFAVPERRAIGERVRSGRGGPRPERDLDARRAAAAERTVLEILGRARG